MKQKTSQLSLEIIAGVWPRSERSCQFEELRTPEFPYLGKSQNTKNDKLSNILFREQTTLNNILFTQGKAVALDRW